MKPLYVLVLAAGQGSRMKSTLPKVLHPVAGRPMLEHVLVASRDLHPKEMALVLGVGREAVRKTLDDRGWKKLVHIFQPEPKGSGHAVLMARPWLKTRKGHLLIVYGDTPLLNPVTLKRLCDDHADSGRAATFLAMDVHDPSGYGRMVLDPTGDLERIVEDKDATPDEKALTLVNSGVACWDIALLADVLPRLKADNAKHEYYLTDAVALLRAGGARVGVVTVKDSGETQGVNTRIDLAKAEALWRRRILERWMLAGVTIVDPDSTYIDAEALLSADSRLWPGTIIQGASRIGAGCEIGPYTIVEDSEIHDGARVGPFARVRPGSVIGKNARIGNFVETKKVLVGEGSKVNHLTYLGDAQLGRDVNIGAGTITCNYDGFGKYRTVIEDSVFVGSNSNLVAPVRLGKGAIIAAGSTITGDVPAEALAVARTPQVVKPAWARTFRERQKEKKHGKHA